MNQNQFGLALTDYGRQTPKGIKAVYFVFYSPTSSTLRPTSGLWLVNYHSYSVMASSRADSNQVDGTKRFRHAVDSNGDRAMSMFDVSTVEPLKLQ